MRKVHLIIFILYLIIAAVYQFNVLTNYKSLPAPLFGGDYYYQMGTISHIIDGGSPLASSSLKGGVCGYMPLYSFLCAKFLTIFRLDILRGEFLFSILLFFMGSLIWYLCGRFIFKDSFIGVVIALLGCSLGTFPVLKYTHFSFLIMFPLFIVFFYRAYNGRRIRDFAVLGLILGLLALSHGVLFIGAVLIVYLYLGVNFFSAALKRKEYAQMGGVFRNWLVLMAVMLPLALLYWFNRYLFTI